MPVQEMERKNPCGENKEIDEYLDGTICEIKTDPEDIDDIEAPEDDEFEVDEPHEPETEPDDRYVGFL